MRIRFSRHAKRRMELYGITETEVKSAIDRGKKEALQSGKTNITYDVGGKFRYPIKIIGIQEGDSFLVVTAYPLKRGKE